MFRVKKLSENAIIPTRGSVLAAGWDLSSAEAKVVPARGRALVKTDLAIAIQPGTYARVAPRSGLTYKKGLDVGAGVIDADYRGNVGVILFNHSPDDFPVAPGDRIAQLIIEKISMAGCEEVDSLTDTERGAGGFGSTGVEAADEEEKKRRRTETERPGHPDVIRVNRLSSTAHVPTRGSELAAGHDLYADESGTIEPGQRALIKTNIAISIPHDCYARVAPRSGLTHKNGLDVGAGVIDADYRGNVGVILFNHSAEPFQYNVGDRVAQLILQKIETYDCLEVDDLEDTARGEGGFGSTGVEQQQAQSTSI